MQQKAESSTGFLSGFTFSLSLQSGEENYFRLCLSSSTDVCLVFHLLLIVFISRPSFEDVLSSGCVDAFFSFFFFFSFSMLWVDLRDCFCLFIYLSLLKENAIIFSSLVSQLLRHTWIEYCFVASYLNQHLFSLFINCYGTYWSKVSEDINFCSCGSSSCSYITLWNFFFLNPSLLSLYLWLRVTGLKMKSDGEVDSKGHRR